MLNLVSVCFCVLQEQAHKTVPGISLRVPLLISPLHEGKLLDLSASFAAPQTKSLSLEIFLYFVSIAQWGCNVTAYFVFVVTIYSHCHRADR